MLRNPSAELEAAQLRNTCLEGEVFEQECVRKEPDHSREAQKQSHYQQTTSAHNYASRFPKSSSSSSMTGWRPSREKKRGRGGGRRTPMMELFQAKLCLALVRRKGTGISNEVLDANSDTLAARPQASADWANNKAEVPCIAN